MDGCERAGRSKDEARASLIDAIALMLDDRREDGLRGVPPDAERETVTVRSNGAHCSGRSSRQHSLALRSGETELLRYAGLSVRDAEGRELPATLNTTATRLTIELDDSGAEYPVVSTRNSRAAPAVRVTPNVEVQFKWITDVARGGRVDVFNNADGVGAPLVTKIIVDQFGQPIISRSRWSGSRFPSPSGCRIVLSGDGFRSNGR
jgi:hypothetical protein